MICIYIYIILYIYIMAKPIIQSSHLACTTMGNILLWSPQSLQFQEALAFRAEGAEAHPFANPDDPAASSKIGLRIGHCAVLLHRRLPLVAAITSIYLQWIMKMMILWNLDPERAGTTQQKIDCHVWSRPTLIFALWLCDLLCNREAYRYTSPTRTTFQCDRCHGPQLAFHRWSDSAAVAPKSHPKWNPTGAAPGCNQGYEANRLTRIKTI